MNYAIQVENLHKTYNQKIKALQGLSFNVEQGTIYGLLGPNGAGKSTTVKILTTLSTADSGSVKIANIDVTQHPAQVKRQIGYVAQKSSVDLDATAKENLELQGRIYGLSGKNLNSRIAELIEQFELKNFADRIAHSYSGGMLRRLDVAMGLIHRPKVLFLDEPTTGLDPESRNNMWQEITRLSQHDTMTILLMTHYLEEADQLAHKVGLVDEGKIVIEGSPAELKKQLHGDMINIALYKPISESLIRSQLAMLSGIHAVDCHDLNLQIRTESSSLMLPKILSQLQQIPLEIKSISASQISLDDVYLHYTGHKLIQN